MAEPTKSAPVDDLDAIRGSVEGLGFALTSRG